MISLRAFTGSASEWDQLIASLPDAHLLQTWEWSLVKAKYGWQANPFVWSDASGSPVAAAMVLKKPVIRRGFAARLCILYVPKGPIMDWRDESLRGRVLDDLQSLAKKQGAIFLKIDPDVVLGMGIPQSETDIVNNGGQAVMSELKRRGWAFSSDQVQFRNTVVIDLKNSEDEILARMKQKTRYNVRLAEKKGVTVRTGAITDLPLLYKMYAETSLRDGFVIRDESYYQTVWQTFMQGQMPRCEPLIAEVDGEAVAAIFLFMFAGRAYYVYGMSRDAHREKMPTYLLQWEAIKRARAAGCTAYDLWGAPDEFNESDGMWGVYRFKEGLGGQVVRTLGAWDFAPNGLWYAMYARVMPKVLDIMRSRGRLRTRESLD
jgi:peptidoglycan pentaglycine glycine transferase (the first glycine)